MKKKTKQVCALTLSAAMAAGMLAGCGSDSDKGGSDSKESAKNVEGKTYNGVDVSEHVDLKMYLLGERTPDFDAVYDEINKILEDKLNCSVSVDFLSWGEHEKKYSLLFSSQEDFDLIFTATSWGHYEQTVALGGFYPMTEDFIQKYAPQTWETVPEVAWEQAKINGEIYMVPNNQTEFGQDVLAVRGDLMEEYNVKSISNWDEMTEFFKRCAENGIYAVQNGPWYQYFQSQGMGLVGGTPKSGELILYNAEDPEDLDFRCIIDWDGFTDYCKQAKEMADAGCWSPDVLSNEEDRQTGLLTGKTAAMVWNMGTCLTYARQANTENPDWNTTLVDPVSDHPKHANPYINNGVAINKNSKNPERAMMALNEFYTNPEIQDLTMLGIEGKHWEAVGENQYKLLDESGYGLDNNCNWGWKNEKIYRTEYVENRTALDDTYDAVKESFTNNQREDHPYDGFNFNTENVTSQVAAVEAAVDTYYKPLINGLVDDVDQSVKDMKSALESAGIRDILTELDKQAADYVAGKQ